MVGAGRNAKKEKKTADTDEDEGQEESWGPSRGKGKATSGEEDGLAEGQIDDWEAAEAAAAIPEARDEGTEAADAMPEARDEGTEAADAMPEAQDEGTEAADAMPEAQDGAAQDERTEVDDEARPSDEAEVQDDEMEAQGEEEEVEVPAADDAPGDVNDSRPLKKHKVGDQVDFVEEAGGAGADTAVDIATESAPGDSHHHGDVEQPEAEEMVVEEEV